MKIKSEIKAKKKKKKKGNPFDNQLLITIHFLEIEVNEPIIL